MKRVPILVAICVLSLTLHARAQLEWRVSVKFILDSNGDRPDAGSLTTDDQVRGRINQANAILDKYGRGYRFELTEIVEVEDEGAAGYFEAEISAVTLLSLEASAKLDKEVYRYREDAINIYISNSTEGAGGICSFPYTTDIILIGQSARGEVFEHEIGHYFGLCHTQGCLCDGCGSPESDNIEDTLPDLPDWTRDDIADHSFGDLYADLSVTNRERVDNVFLNVMSYHDDRNRFTPDQLDIMADNSNGPRNNVANGRTRFVDKSSDCLFEDGSPTCHLTDPAGPFKTVAGGVESAAAGDIVLIREGTYSSPSEFSKRLTLRASRGKVVLTGP